MPGPQRAGKGKGCLWWWCICWGLGRSFPLFKVFFFFFKFCFSVFYSTVSGICSSLVYYKKYLEFKNKITHTQKQINV